jgi:hypothetical protein
LTPTPTPTVTPTPPTGDAALVSQGSGKGKPGDTVDLGSFTYTPGTGSTQQVISSATVSISKPKLFSSVTLTALFDGDPIGSSTVNAPDIDKSTVFTFSPPLELEGEEQLTFELSGVIAGKAATGALALPAKVKLAAVIGGSKPNGFGGTINLMFALSLFGFVMAPLSSTRQRRRVSMLAAAMIVLATVMAGCGGSSGGAPSSSASQQELTGLDVTQNSSPVTVSGLPIDLGKIRKQ